MNADQVRALVAKKYPEAMKSPLAQVMDAASALSKLEVSNPDEVMARLPYKAEAFLAGEWRTYKCDTIADLEALQQVFAVACVPYR